MYVPWPDTKHTHHFQNSNVYQHVLDIQNSYILKIVQLIFKALLSNSTFFVKTSKCLYDQNSNTNMSLIFKIHTSRLKSRDCSINFPDITQQLNIVLTSYHLPWTNSAESNASWNSTVSPQITRCHCLWLVVASN